MRTCVRVCSSRECSIRNVKCTVRIPKMCCKKKHCSFETPLDKKHLQFLLKSNCY